MRHRIGYANGRYSNFASGSKNLIEWLKILKDEEISDIRKEYKSGVSDSVLDTYRKIFGAAMSCPFFCFAQRGSLWVEKSDKEFGKEL